MGQDERCVELLLAAGADVDARDSNENTPLVSLLNQGWEKGKAGAARLVLEVGAAPLALSSNGMGAYEFAIFGEDPVARPELKAVFAEFVPAHFKGE